MECCGCAMVLLGVLIVLCSLKMRARRDFELAQLDNPFAWAQGGELSRAQSAARGRAVSPAWSFVAAPTRPALKRTLSFRRRPLRPATAGSLGLRQGRLTDEMEASLSHELQLSSAAASMGPADGSPPLADNIGEGDADSATLSARFSTTNWLPCDEDEEIGVTHQAATIEAALSLVLTAATLVGFRPDTDSEALMNSRLDGGRHERLCCLHHTVQVSRLPQRASGAISSLD